MLLLVLSKKKTGNEMRISDWSSDVCSSELQGRGWPGGWHTVSTYLYRLGRFVARFRWWVIAAWLVVAVGAGTLSTALGGSLQSTFEIPGTQAQSALDALEDRKSTRLNSSH